MIPVYTCAEAVIQLKEFNERGFRGPVPFEMISEVIAPGKIGVYVLSNSGTGVYYVGRSDGDLRRSLGDWYWLYRKFWFRYETTIRNAFLRECRLYHKYDPPDNDIHPTLPSGRDWRCPVRGCEWRRCD